ncbi:MAG: hypothetical protein IT304_00600 [Dehalococcoidia bacterium]|nr:hypothetical protein [Dehalococcoidia bacterium]
MSHPRATLLPLVAIQLPVTLISSLVTVALYFSVFRDEPFESVNDVLAGGASGPLFALILLTAFEGLFAQVARAATIVAVASALEGRPKQLTESLDPAFTRMGGLLVVAVLLAASVVGLALTLVGLVLLPYLAARLGLVFEAYMLDGLGPGRAIGRSWRVMRGNVLRFLTAVLLFLLVAAGPLVLISLLGSVDFGGRDTRVLTSAAIGLAQGVLLIPLLAFLTAITTAFYLQARARHDGRTTA